MSVIERLLRRDTADADRSAGDALIISPMKRRDLARGVMAIEAVSYPRPWSQNVFESEIAQTRTGARYYVVARRPATGGVRRGLSTLVGYAGLWFTDGDAHVTNVAVQPSQQRTGVASTLMLALADEAIGEERLQGRGQRTHASPAKWRSSLSPASASSSGAADRYQ